MAAKKTKPVTKKSAAETKLRENAKAGRKPTPPEPETVDVTMLEELTLRTLYYEAEVIRQKMRGQEQVVLERLHAQPEMKELNGKLAALQVEMSKEVDKVAAAHDVDPQYYTFHVDKKKLVRDRDGKGT